MILRGNIRIPSCIISLHMFLLQCRTTQKRHVVIRHPILLLCINTCGIICTVRHVELEDYACVMTVVQTDSYIKKYTVRSILLIFNCRSKIYNQSWSHKSVRMVSAFQVYIRIILLDHNFHYNTTLQTFQLPSTICILQQ